MKILWDLNIQTDTFLEARCPDIAVTDKEKQETWIIDIAIPEYLRVREKELEKKVKITRSGNRNEKTVETSVKIVPIVVGVPGTVWVHVTKPDVPNPSTVHGWVF